MAASVSVTRAAVFVAGCDDSRSLLAPAIALMNVSFRIKRRKNVYLEVSSDAAVPR